MPRPPEAVRSLNETRPVPDKARICRRATTERVRGGLRRGNVVVVVRKQR